MGISVVGVDLSKSVFQLSVADAKHRVVDQKRLNRWAMRSNYYMPNMSRPMYGEPRQMPPMPMP